VTGVLYATNRFNGRKAHLSFDGRHTFSLADEIGEDSGMYRVEGNTIILALNDTTTYTTQIRSWNGDGSLGELSFDDRLYAAEKPDVESEPVQTTIVYVPALDPPILIGGPRPHPHPYPPQPINPIIPTPPPAPPIPTASTPPSRPINTSADRPRDFGSKRPPNK